MKAGDIVKFTRNKVELVGKIAIVNNGVNEVIVGNSNLYVLPDKDLTLVTAAPVAPVVPTKPKS